MTMLKRLIVPLSIALLMVACNPAPTPTKLAVTSRTPAAGATGVAVDAVVKATFNVAVKVASLDNNFTLSQGGTAVTGTVTYDAATRTATFTPAAPLANDTEYTATVKANVESSQGSRLATDASWSFTTVGAGVTPGVTDVVVTSSAYVTTIGGTQQYDAAVTTIGGASDAVTWSSSDESIATVDADGLVTGIAAGTATITATSVFDTSVSDSADIEVAPALAFADGYALVVANANVNDVISVAAPTPSSPGYGTLTYAITAGELPPVFTVDDGTSLTDYSVALDPNTGTIAGSTGFPGSFTGTVTVTDALGQTADIDFSLALALVFDVYDSAGTTPEHVFPFSDTSVFVVPGDRIHVSGVPNTLWLPDAFADALAFSLDFVSSDPVQPAGAEDTAFLVNANQGTVSYGDADDSVNWVYNLTLDYLTEPATSVQLTFEGASHL